MRRYIGSKILTDKELSYPTGIIGEIIFKKWFNHVYESSQLFKSNEDRDKEGIDFNCDYGYTYQVKATKHKTYTFNSQIDCIRAHLRSDLYVFIRIVGKVAYIENIYQREYVLDNIKESRKFNNCFIWAKDLKTEINYIG